MNLTLIPQPLSGLLRCEVSLPGAKNTREWQVNKGSRTTGKLGRKKTTHLRLCHHLESDEELSDAAASKKGRVKVNVQVRRMDC